jgi:polyferredoxin
MRVLQPLGTGLFLIALLLFTGMNFLGSYRFDPDRFTIAKPYHQKAIADAAGKMTGTYPHSFAFVRDFREVLLAAQRDLEARAQYGIPEGVAEWDFKMGDGEFKSYTMAAAKSALRGPVKEHPLLFLALTFGLSILGGLCYFIPLFTQIPGIRHDGIYQASLTRGLKPGRWHWAPGPGWLGVLAGLYLIAFYVFLYWAPEHLTAWMTMADPLSLALSGKEAGQWFVYGLLYTVAVLVMGVRMIAKYRHNRYQMIRTGSVMFFQLSFAFLIPEILVRLNQPYYDFKNIWPLNYTFFFDWNLDQLLSSGGLGLFMLVWGIALVVIAVPVFTYFFGKRWYCSWVCGCGGLAETFGDPFRQLSDKRLSAWKIERWMVHGVLVFAVVMTGLVLYTYFSGQDRLFIFNSYEVRSWYGFLIGSAFAGVVGTGFYPLMGNRVWCRFGCPLAAYLGLVQRFKSRYRISTNGGQCISCGNCSTYCEMGIDVRWYAQRGQDVVRASCVGCGVCSAVCPRGVLRLENS